MIRGLAIVSLLLAAAPWPAAADLAVERRDDRLSITTAAGEPVADYVFADRAIGRPSLRDLRTPDGVNRAVDGVSFAIEMEVEGFEPFSFEDWL